MKRFRNALLIGFGLLLTLGWSAAAQAATINGMVTNNSGQTGRIFLQVLWQGSNYGNLGASIPSTSSTAAYSIQGLPDNGSFVVLGYVDKNNDGLANISEGYGWSNSFSISNGTVSGTANLTLNPQNPADVVPVAVPYLEAAPFNGGVLLMWETPVDNNYFIFTQADSFRVEWSTNGFATVAGSKEVPAGSGRDDDGFFVTPLINNTTYSFRVKSVVGAQTATSVVATATPAAPVGGHAISGTISIPAGVSVPANTPFTVIVEAVADENIFFLKTLPSFVNGTTYSISGIPDGSYWIQGLADVNKDNRPSAGDYWTGYLTVTVSGANVAGKTLAVSNQKSFKYLEVNHIFKETFDSYMVCGGVESGAKRPVNVRMAGPHFPLGGVDLAWLFNESEANYCEERNFRPLLTDQYSFNIGYSDGTSESLIKTPGAVYDSPVANNMIPNGTITAMPANITWTPSAPLPAGWMVEVALWGMNGHVWDSGDLPPATTSVAYDGPALSPGSYTLSVGFCEGLNWNCVSRHQSLTVVSGTCAAPASITVPVADNDGSYTVSWGASATAGTSYQLQEATNSTFTTGLRTAYTGTALSANIAGRSQNVTYYYRVRATKPNYLDSSYRTAASGCAVPGTAVAGAPASISAPVLDADGSYAVSWGASATAGVTYELQEATDSTFVTGLRSAYRGTALSVNITGRSQNKTYYYRVRAIKAGMKDSGYRTTANGCAVPGAAMAGMPASITVPVADPDGVYTVGWGASATAGVTYELQEATSSNFTTGLRTAYRGTARSVGISGRSQNVTYYYRVRAVKAGLRDSGYFTQMAGCAVPGTATAAMPASITIPASDPDGAYTISWGASATTGATYELYEATNNTFTAGVRPAYRGTALSAGITGRVAGTTYYYRVRAVKGGLRDSSYRTMANGCVVGP